MSIKTENKIYSEILKILESQIRSEEEIKFINVRLGKINGNVHDHCKRIKVLENEKLKTKTIVSVVAIFVSFIWSIALFIFK